MMRLATSRKLIVRMSVDSRKLTARIKQGFNMVQSEDVSVCAYIYACIQQNFRIAAVYYPEFVRSFALALENV